MGSSVSGELGLLGPSRKGSSSKAAMAQWGPSSRFSPEREIFSQSSAERTRAAHKARSPAPDSSATQQPRKAAGKTKEPAAKKARQETVAGASAGKKARKEPPSANEPRRLAETSNQPQLRRGDRETTPPHRSLEHRTEGRPQSPVATETGASDPERAAVSAETEGTTEDSTEASQLH
uniref:Uncharacterized protein n=1 Tax=Sphaerodactylus townsendi TaxID=933632 RepID=A0ACB8F2V2_9SAUR